MTFAIDPSKLRARRATVSSWRNRSNAAADALTCDVRGCEPELGTAPSFM